MFVGERTRESNDLRRRRCLATGVDYDNRFCSIIRIENAKIAHWRDYMDSLAASKALNARGR
jgi:uncharacterized protein